MLVRYIHLIGGLLLLSLVTALAQPCNIPFNIRFENKTTTSITVTWSDINVQPEGWEIEIVQRGDAQTGIPSVPLQTGKSVSLEQLTPSTSYDLYIRTVCANNKSNWNVAIPFTTIIEVPSACQINIPLKDNGTEILELDIPYLKTLQNPILGVNVFLSKVDLILEHGWPADLNIILQSPQGQQLVLSNHNGTVTQNFGIHRDTSCFQATTFSMDGCRDLKDYKPPFVGVFRPDGAISGWKPDTLSKGTWKLITFDRAVKDAGILHYLNITFSDEVCIVPDDFSVINADINEVSLGWSHKEPCNTVNIRVYEAGIAVDSFFVPCREGHFTIKNLKPNTEYGFSISSLCTHTISSSDGCLIYASTSCEPVSILESFDNYELCEESCITFCNNTGTLWFNITDADAQDWILAEGRTETSFTGPDSDVNGSGRYMYIENNPQLCGNNNKAILQSTCMQILSNPSGCDMSFYYHMYGDDIELLKLELSIDGGFRWIELFSAEGNQGNQWIKHTLSLQEYEHQLGIFRFTGISGAGPLADIAIDQIEFYKSIPADNPIVFYRDQDGDGYGSDTDFVLSCAYEPPNGYVIKAGDCEDNNPSIHPGATEIQCNGIDENCNGNEDDQPETNPISVSRSIQDASCNGSSDGSIQLNISGGNPPYNVSWNNGMSDEVITDLGIGIYFATITDIGGCVYHTPFYTLQSDNNLNIVIRDIQPASCLGKSDGSIEISHSSDAAPYRYLWSDGTTNQNLEHIGEGIYVVTVTDANHCFAVLSDIKVNYRSSVIAGIRSQKDPSCSESEDGHLEAFALNGVAPYTYLWSGGQTTNLINNLTSGTYTCTITDSNACQYILNAELASQEALKIQVVSTENVRCFGEANGSIKTHVTGGKPGYTYLWNDFRYTVDDIFNIPAGQYILTVTDANGCKAQSPMITIHQPEPLQVAIDSIVPASCISGNNGQIRLNTSGGNGTYFFVWNEQSNVSNILDSIPRGHYNVTVYDQLGCKSGIPVIEVPYINTLVNVRLNLIEGNVCYGGKEGILEVTIENGTPEYDYNWSHGRQYFYPLAVDTISKLGAGNYKLTITDVNGCTGISNTVLIPELPEFSYAIASVVNNSCQEDSTGIIHIQVKGGAQPHEIAWNNGQYSGDLIDHLPNGSYYGYIKDSVGCQLAIDTLKIQSFSNISIASDISHEINSASDGKICLDINNGIPPYKYQWSNGQSGKSCIENLNAGTYTVTVTDDIGCIQVASFVVEALTSVISEQYPDLIMYPNPVLDLLTIQTTLRINSYTLLDMNGIVLQNAKPKIVDGRFTIAMNDLVAGMYILVLQDDFRVMKLKVVRID